MPRPRLPAHEVSGQAAELVAWHSAHACIGHSGAVFDLAGGRATG